MTRLTQQGSFISTHAVSDSYTHVCKHLKVIWDIKVAELHQFITELYLLSNGVKRDEFNESSEILQENIVAIFIEFWLKTLSTPPLVPYTNNTSESRKPAHTHSIKHSKASNNSDANIFVIGDSKVRNDSTYYFWNWIDHRNWIKWHMHKLEDYHTWYMWL